MTKNTKTSSKKKQKKSAHKNTKNSSAIGKKKTHQRPQNKAGLSFVKNLKDLKNLLSKGYHEFRIALGGTAGAIFSRKEIQFHKRKDGRNYWIWNHIDDSEQILTEKQLMNKNYTNIGMALKRNSLIVDLTDRNISFNVWPCGCIDETCEDCAIGICEHD